MNKTAALLNIEPLIPQDQPWITALSQSANVYCPDCQRHDLGYSATIADKKIAYIVWQIAADEATLLGIAVQQPYQHQGIARRLHQYSLSTLSQHRIRTLFLEVRYSNHHAQYCYQRLGYQIIATRKNYYRDLNDATRKEDAIIMRQFLSAVTVKPSTSGGG